MFSLFWLQTQDPPPYPPKYAGLAKHVKFVRRVEVLRELGKVSRNVLRIPSNLKHKVIGNLRFEIAFLFERKHLDWPTAYTWSHVQSR